MILYGLDEVRVVKAVCEGSAACFDAPFTPESFWYLTSFICTRIIPIMTTLRSGKDAKGLFTGH